MPLDASQVTIAINAQHTSLLDLATAVTQLNVNRAYATTNGTGANQADRIFHDRRTLAASATEDLDLAGSLIDPYGATITFARIKALLVAASTANTNNVIVGGAAANGFITWVGAATHTLTVRPGGLLLLVTGGADTTGYAVTAGTGDLLHIANSGAGTGVDYDVVLIGASA